MLIVILRIERDSKNGGWMYHVRDERGQKSFIKIKNHAEYEQLYDSGGGIRRGRSNHGYFQDNRDRYREDEIRIDTTLKVYIPKKPVMPKSELLKRMESNERSGLGFRRVRPTR